MADQDNRAEVPEGAAVFPEIPPAVGVDPLFLAVIHASVFLAGSDEKIVNPAAAAEAVEAMGQYLARLPARQLDRLQQELDRITAYAKKERWPKELIRATTSFLDAYGLKSRKKA